MIDIVVPKVKAEWNFVAYAMGYRIYEVNDIHKDGYDNKDRCVRLFSKWLTTSSDKTWQTLINHIKKVDNLTAVVEEIEEELMIQCEKQLMVFVMIRIIYLYL